MSFVARLACVCVIGAGSGVPIYLLTAKECSGFSKKQWINLSYPLLTCRGNKTHINLYLAFKGGAKTGEIEKNLYLKGVDVKNGKEIDWEEKLNATNRIWRLTIYSSTGTTWLGRLDGSNEGNYNDENIDCNKDALVVTEWNYEPQSQTSRSWEKDVASIKLELGKCEVIEGRKVCEIKIANGVGLKINEKFNPKAIFCTSS